MKIWIKIIFLIMLCIIIAIFIKETKGTEEEIEILINGQKLILSKTDTIYEKNMEMFNLEEKIGLKNLSNTTIYINNIKVKPKEQIGITITEINKENKIKIRVKLANENLYTKYEINTLPSDFPDYETTGNSKYEGDYYLVVNSTNNQNSYLIKVNENGKIIFYKKTNRIAWDFRKYDNDSKIRYTYLETNLKTRYYTLCDLVVLDENYKEIDRVNYSNENDEKLGTDNHESMYIDDGHYVLVTYQNKEVDNIPEELEYPTNFTVSNCLIKEIKNGQTIWEFESSNYPELYKYYSNTGVSLSTMKREYLFNYTHFNSFTIDGKDNNLICSFRNLDSLIKIDRTNGKIIWILGGIGDQFRFDRGTEIF